MMDGSYSIFHIRVKKRRTWPVEHKTRSQLGNQLQRFVGWMANVAASITCPVATAKQDQKKQKIRRKQKKKKKKKKIHQI